MRAFGIPPRWYGAHPGGELRLDLPPAAVLQRIRAEVDELHSWHGGGVAFGKKPFLGEVKPSGFRVRPLSFRRDGATGFLVGEVQAVAGGSRVRYRIESPAGFVRSLPIASIAPPALLGIGGYLAAPALAPSGPAHTIGLVSACALLGLVLSAALGSLVVYGIRSDTRRLMSFLSTTLRKESAPDREP